MDYPRGGMGTISEAMMNVIESSGGKVHLSAPVKNIAVDKSRAVGVCLKDGTFVRSSNFLSSILITTVCLSGQRKELFVMRMCGPCRPC